MEMQKEQVGDAHVVTVVGRLDGIYSSAFANQVGELITGTNPKILIDFTDIDYVSSAGLRALLLLVKAAKASGGAFALCGLNAQVREVLDVSGFTPMFSIHPGRAEGIAALNAMSRVRAYRGAIGKSKLRCGNGSSTSSKCRHSRASHEALQQQAIGDGLLRDAWAQRAR